jgi:hypothetical protein
MVWWLKYGLLLAAAMGFAWWHQGQVHAIERVAHAAGVAEQVAKYTDAALKAEQTQQSITAARLKAQKENFDESARVTARAHTLELAQAARAAPIDQRLRDALDAVAARNRPASTDSAPLVQCKADLGNLGQVLQASRRQHQQLGRDADAELNESVRRGLECERSYDSLGPGG